MIRGNSWRKDGRGELSRCSRRDGRRDSCSSKKDGSSIAVGGTGEGIPVVVRGKEGLSVVVRGMGRGIPVVIGKMGVF